MTWKEFEESGLPNPNWNKEIKDSDYKVDQRRNIPKPEDFEGLTNE